MSKNDAIPHPLARLRRSRGWSQMELARRSGVARTSVSAVECGRLTPSVVAALALARTLECTVEELFGYGGDEANTWRPRWAWEPAGEPCRYWEAEVGGRRWRYPAQTSTTGGIPHDGVWHSASGTEKDLDPGVAANTLVVACCDPAAGLLAAEYRERSGFRMLTLQRGGAAALDLLKRGLVHVAGLHRSTIEQPGRNAESVLRLLGQGYGLIRAAGWQAGVAVAPGRAGPTLSTLGRRAWRWALREPGSAARECLDELLGNEPASGRIVGDHAAVAAAVGAGWADAGVCVRLVADEAGLDFLPVHEELLDFCYPQALVDDPRLRSLVRLLGSKAHRRMVGELPGYDTRDTGEVYAP